ncbi:hypothetical protein [Orrella sp. 11846]|uniref:hypothetical protein n=1 Tax=Orrella sp. 11846 TaxID=3409913 RepID=UPI003B5A73C1
MSDGTEEEIMSQFSDVTNKTTKDHLAHCVSEFDGRLVLIIVLDRFLRSVWSDAFVPSPRMLLHCTHYRRFVE